MPISTGPGIRRAPGHGMEIVDEVKEEVGAVMNEHQPLPEGTTTRTVERVTARAPSIVFLAAAGASMVASIGLFLGGRKLAGIFVGLWPPTFLLLGNYNKMVKSLGS